MFSDEAAARLRDRLADLWDGDDDPADQSWRQEQADRAMSVVRPELDRLARLRDEVSRLSRAVSPDADGLRLPDDAVEKLARWLFRMNGRTVGESLYGDAAASPERQERRWNTWLEDEDRDRLREMARHVLADLGAPSTTETAPGPAAVQWGVRIDGSSVQLFDTEHEARDWMTWTAKRATESTFEVVSRTATPWTPVPPAASQDTAETADTLLNAKHPRRASDSTVPLHDCGGDPKCCGDPDQEPSGGDAAHPVATGHDDGLNDYADDLIPDLRLTVKAKVGACSCHPVGAAIHQRGSYCGDAQHEQVVDVVRAAVGRPGDERDEETVAAVLAHLANPTSKEKP